VNKKVELPFCIWAYFSCCVACLTVNLFVEFWPESNSLSAHLLKSLVCPLLYTMDLTHLITLFGQLDTSLLGGSPGLSYSMIGTLGLTLSYELILE
jgi:hypothetical protein